MAISTFPAPSGGKTLQTVFITSTQSWTAPAGVTAIEILLVAGGGGGGAVATTNASAGGGGGGGVIVDTVSVTPGTSYTVTVGAGGAAGSGTGAGGNGSNSTFGSLRTCYGGAGGTGYGGNRPVDALYGGGSGRAYNFQGGVSGGGGGAGFMLSLHSSGGPSFNTDDMWVIQGTMGWNPNNGAGYTYAGNSGLNGYGAGGGGGNASNSYQVAKGGVNAGHGATPLVGATAATANFGGGGGGGAYNAGVKAPSAGGSGVCVIKYWA